jgi:SAM-dependent methyltransferase
VCHARLTQTDQHFRCINPQCGKEFPVVGGIPILFNEHSSLFSIKAAQAEYSSEPERRRPIFLRTLLPGLSKNINSSANLAQFVQLLQSTTDLALVLVIGGRKLGAGMEHLVQPHIRLVDTDVSIGARTVLLCDAHDIPFEDATFDGVVAQAVLEHVADPYRCVDEIHRVLKTDGYVYAETPFMQQMHGGNYGDFTRFTYTGHRRLFRKFSEVDSGAVCGPGMALAWSIEAFMLSFASTKRTQSLLRLFTRVACSCLKYVDYYLINKPGALGAASAYYFLGRRSDHTFSDRELMALSKVRL